MNPRTLSGSFSGLIILSALFFTTACNNPRAEEARHQQMLYASGGSFSSQSVSHQSALSQGSSSQSTTSDSFYNRNGNRVPPSNQTIYVKDKNSAVNPTISRKPRTENTESNQEDTNKQITVRSSEPVQEQKASPTLTRSPAPQAHMTASANMGLNLNPIQISADEVVNEEVILLADLATQAKWTKIDAPHRMHFEGELPLPTKGTYRVIALSRGFKAGYIDVAGTHATLRITMDNDKSEGTENAPYLLHVEMNPRSETAQEITVGLSFIPANTQLPETDAPTIYALGKDGSAIPLSIWGNASQTENGRMYLKYKSLRNEVKSSTIRDWIFVAINSNNQLMDIAHGPEFFDSSAKQE